MDPFEYLSVFISVVIGLAVVHLLSGVSLILDTREHERVDWIHGTWTANVFVTTVLVWWFNFSLTGIREWTLPYFVNLVGYCIVLYLLAGLLYPVRGADVVDFRAHFEANRPRFFTVLLGFQLVDFTDAALERQALGTDWNVLHLVSVVVFGAAFMGGIKTGNRTYHGVVAVAWLLTCIGWGVSGFHLQIAVQ